MEVTLFLPQFHISPSVTHSSLPTSISLPTPLFSFIPLPPRPTQLSTTSRGLETDDMHLARDSLEVMSLSLAISPQVLASLETSQDWKHFVIDSVLLIRNRLGLHASRDTCIIIIAHCARNNNLSEFIMKL